MNKTWRFLGWFLIMGALLGGCGGVLDIERQQEYIDRCVIEAGPQSAQNNVLEYCRAKWRQSQRER